MFVRALSLLPVKCRNIPGCWQHFPDDDPHVVSMVKEILDGRAGGIFQVMEELPIRLLSIGFAHLSPLEQTLTFRYYTAVVHKFLSYHNFTIPEPKKAGVVLECSSAHFTSLMKSCSVLKGSEYYFLFIEYSL